MRQECFGASAIGCRVLRETMCDTGPCPFYKTRERYEQEFDYYEKIANGGVGESHGVSSASVSTTLHRAHT